MNHQPKSGGNLDPEMLAAYIDRRLSPEQRAAVEAELARDPDSYAVLAESLKALDALPGDLDSKQRRRVWPLVAAALAAAAAIIVTVRLQDNLFGSRANPLLTQVVAAAGDERYVEGRLTGGFGYSPLRSVTRGESSTPRELALRGLIDSLGKQITEHPSDAAIHALAIAQLQSGDADAAIATFNRIDEKDRSALVRSDFAAALIQRARVSGSSADLPHAVAETERAIAMDGSLVEARFNRALALQRMGSPAARDAWTDYLSRDAASPWTAEARAYLQP